MSTATTPSARAVQQQQQQQQQQPQQKEACLKSLSTLTDALSTSLTCSICLEHMRKPRQLQCGHLFCADCVVRILRMPKVRCALCKQKTGKRMIRIPPLPFHELVQGVTLLQKLIDQHQRHQRAPALNDGFSALQTNHLVARLHNERLHRLQQTNRPPPRPSIDQNEDHPDEQNRNTLNTNATNTKSNTARKKSKNSAKRKSQPPSVHDSTSEQNACSLTPVPSSNTTDRAALTGSQSTADKVCILCPTRHHPPGSTSASDSTRPDFGKWMKVSAQTNFNAVLSISSAVTWVHENCAMYSEDVYTIDVDTVENLDRLFCRNRECAHCQNRADGPTIFGATVKCCYADCQKYYHYACATHAGCTFIEDGYRMFCPAHADKAPDINDAQFLQALSSQSDPQVRQHDDFCYICHTGGKLLMCDSCQRTSHVACSALRSIPLGDWDCSVCTGTHTASQFDTPRSVGLPRGVSPQSSSADKRPKKRSSVSVDHPSTAQKRARIPQLLELDDASSMHNSLRASVSPGMSTSAASPSVLPSPLLTVSEPVATPLSAPPTAKRGRRPSDGVLTPSGGRRIVVVTTGLNDEQKDSFARFARAHRMTVKDDVGDKVTHVVIGARAPTDKPTRTMKLCKAVAKKLPILCWQWVAESSAASRASAAAPLPIDPYMHAVSRAHDEDEGVFDGKSFCFSTFSGDKNKRDELEQLITLGGGRVVQKHELRRLDVGDVLFVKNDDAASAKRASGRMSKSNRFDPPSGATVIAYTWILDQITQR